MGIYIPNMEKPKSCWECRLMDGEANCLVTDEGISSKQEGIHPDCPLIDIVTCGECKYYEESEYIWGVMVCKYHMGHSYCTKADRFCSHGERK